MKDIYELVSENEANLEEFMNWQIEFGPTNDFRNFSELTSKAEDVFKYAAILYPRFILVEGAMVLADHYTEENWKSWREKLGPIETANIVNHTHIEDYLANDYFGVEKLEEGLGNLLAFFWQMAANQQFPGKCVKVEFNGNVINIINE